MSVRKRLIPHTNINSKWILDQNVNCKTIKLLEENIGENLHDLGLGKTLLDMTTKAHTTKGGGKTNWTSSKLQKLLGIKDTIKKEKR